jgi:pilus assembly protein Flp/PilA
MTNLLKRFKNDESGATAIEYGLIAALIGTAIIVAVGAVGTNLTQTFERIRDSIGPATAGGGS